MKNQNSKHTIRRAEHRDVEGIILTHSRSIRELCAKDYTTEQIEAWAGRNFKASESIDRDFVWVIVVESEVRGFGHLAVMSESVGEIMGLFVSPEIYGIGAGKELLETMKKEARSFSLSTLELYSTLTALPFYISQGFLSRGLTTVDIRGVAIPCSSMEFRL